MERLTSTRTWEEASRDLANEPGYRYIWQRLQQYENIGLDPQSVQMLADAILGEVGVFCPVCGDGLELEFGQNGLMIGCFGCGEYVPVKELFEAYRAMKERERTWNG